MEAKLSVKLLRYTPEPQKTVAAAAKLCYSECGVSEITQDLSNEECEKFLNILIKMGHFSPIEHANFTFAIEGVSRALTHQLVRHRLASFSQQSQRYVAANDIQHIIPPNIAKSQKANDVFCKILNEINTVYGSIRDILIEENKKQLLLEGKDEKTAYNLAEKLANEDARFVLPNSSETKITVTMNARELRHFFNQRCCNRAQWEIRNLAIEMLRLVSEVAPILFKNAGPKCLVENCPEGVMSCGKSKEVKGFFGKLN